DSQSTAAWGDPAAAVFRCGGRVPEPTTDERVEANGVDWVVHEGGSNWRITTYGRDPAMEVLFDVERISVSSVMVDIGNAARRIPAEGGCTDPEDSEEIPEDQDQGTDELPEGVVPEDQTVSPQCVGQLAVIGPVAIGCRSIVGIQCRCVATFVGTWKWA